MTQLTASLEDYLEAIWMIRLNDKVVRVKNLTQSMNVRTSSVISALKNLADRGLVIHEKYGYIELTPEGETLAKELYGKHIVLTKFLNEILGIDHETAERDACQIEHHVHRKTMERIIKFMQFIETYAEGEPEWLSNFHYYAKQGSRSGEGGKRKKQKRRQ